MNRDRNLNIRLSEAELKTIKDRAEAAGMGISEFVRIASKLITSENAINYKFYHKKENL